MTNEAKVSFWCDRCGKDFHLAAYVSSVQGEKYFWAKCPDCRRKLVRYIENVHLDPYYRRSFRLKVQRRELRKDLIQPDDPLFKVYYRQEWEKLEKAKADFEAKERLKKKSRDDFYMRYRHDINARSLAKKVLDAEEQLDVAAR